MISITLSTVLSCLSTFKWVLRCADGDTDLVGEMADPELRTARISCTSSSFDCQMLVNYTALHWVPNASAERSETDPIQDSFAGITINVSKRG